MKLTKLTDLLPDLEDGHLTYKELAAKWEVSTVSINLYVKKLRTNGYTIPKRRRGKRGIPLE